jgi:hypothetical protein
VHKLMPATEEIAFLRNPTNPNFSALETRELQGAAVVLGVRLLLLNASSPPEIEEAFANIVAQRAGAFLLGHRPFFYQRARSTRHACQPLQKKPGICRCGTACLSGNQRAGNRTQAVAAYQKQPWCTGARAQLQLGSTHRQQRNCTWRRRRRRISSCAATGRTGRT